MDTTELTPEQKEDLKRLDQMLYESAQEMTCVKEYASQECGEEVLGLAWIAEEEVWRVRLLSALNGEHYVRYKVSRDGEDFRVTRLK